jgi:hypothetical protein
VLPERLTPRLGTICAVQSWKKDCARAAKSSPRSKAESIVILMMVVMVMMVVVVSPLLDDHRFGRLNFCSLGAAGIVGL